MLLQLFIISLILSYYCTLTLLCPTYISRHLLFQAKLFKPQLKTGRCTRTVFSDMCKVPNNLMQTVNPPSYDKLSLTELYSPLAPDYLDKQETFDFRLQLPFISCLLGKSRIGLTKDHSRLAQVTARPGYYINWSS